MRPFWTLDFETKPIVDGHGFPEPVGLAVRTPDGAHAYVEGARDMTVAVRRAIRDARVDLVMHNGVGFDIGVAAQHLGVGIDQWPWESVQDTLVLHACAFPLERHGLKEVAVRLLGDTTGEADELRDWVFANLPEAKGKSRTWKGWRALVWRVPVAIRERYALADCDLAAKLWLRLQPHLRAASRARGYRRLVEATPLLLQSSLDGFHADERSLSTADAEGSRLLKTYDRRIGKMTNRPGLDVDSDEFAEALRPWFDPAVMPTTTPTGKLSTARGALLAALPPGALRDAVVERGLLATILRTFVQPWSEIANATGGRVRTSWRVPGARTGRLSSSPNMQNMVGEEKIGDLPFPHVRRFVLPDTLHGLVGADFSQQELRLLAHFEAGPLLRLYQRFPDVDIHEAVGFMIREASGIVLSRKIVKIANFLTIYGGGAAAMAAQAGITVAEAREVQALYARALPSVKSTARAAEACARSPGYITTLGGRDIPSDGRDYALLNYLIQGSAADQTYETLRVLWTHRAGWWRFRLTVHDEFLLSVSRDHLDAAAAMLRQCMMVSAANLGVDCPFAVDTYRGRNWGDVKKDKKG